MPRIQKPCSTVLKHSQQSGVAQIHSQQLSVFLAKTWRQDSNNRSKQWGDEWLYLLPNTSMCYVTLTPSRIMTHSLHQQAERFESPCSQTSIYPDYNKSHTYCFFERRAEECVIPLPWWCAPLLVEIWMRYVVPVSELCLQFPVHVPHAQLEPVDIVVGLMSRKWYPQYVKYLSWTERISMDTECNIHVSLSTRS